VRSDAERTEKDHGEHADADYVDLIDAAYDRETDELAGAKIAPAALDPGPHSLGPQLLDRDEAHQGDSPVEDLLGALVVVVPLAAHGSPSDVREESVQRDGPHLVLEFRVVAHLVKPPVGLRDGLDTDVAIDVDRLGDTDEPEPLAGGVP
jgi:hypothetical protein